MPDVPPLELHTILLVAAAGLFAGVQNALAGGGSFITFPTLLLAGLNPVSANMTSTIALFPSQTTSAVAGRKLVEDVGPLTFKQMFIISIIGGIIGAILLYLTPPTFFVKLVPWLVLFATSMFAWGAFRKQPIQLAMEFRPRGIQQDLIRAEIPENMEAAYIRAIQGCSRTTLTKQEDRILRTSHFTRPTDPRQG